MDKSEETLVQRGERLLDGCIPVSRETPEARSRRAAAASCSVYSASNFLRFG